MGLSSLQGGIPEGWEGYYLSSCPRCLVQYRMESRDSWTLTFSGPFYSASLAVNTLAFFCCCSQWLLSGIWDDTQLTQDVLCEWALLAGWLPSHLQPIVKPHEKALWVGWDETLEADAVFKVSLSPHCYQAERLASHPLVFQTQMCLITYKYHSLTAPKNNN